MNPVDTGGRYRLAFGSVHEPASFILLLRDSLRGYDRSTAPTARCRVGDLVFDGELRRNVDEATERTATSEGLSIHP